jgi:hypothetical protein
MRDRESTPRIGCVFRKSKPAVKKQNSRTVRSGSFAMNMKSSQPSKEFEGND